MTCHNCRSECKRSGKHRNGLERFRCNQCRNTFTEPHERPLDEMRLPVAKAEMVLKLMVEGMSIRSIERLTEVHRDTIMRLLVLAGERCEILLGETVQNIRAKDVEVDEVWTYIRKKENKKTPEEADDAGIGDAYTFVAIERNTKLVLAWHLGRRTRISTMHFMGKLRKALNPMHWFQLTSDGFRPYVEAVKYQLGRRVDFAQLVKVYATAREGEQRYSPGDVIETIPTPIFGNPDPDRICTSHVERQNLTMRMQIRRLTRLTNAFSKKWENLRAALALHFAWYNFVRVHRT